MYFDMSGRKKVPKLRASKGKKRLWCLCKGGEKGRMIKCDNGDCPIEWFHFRCVKVTAKPKGKWHCPKCKPKLASSRQRNVARKSTSGAGPSSMASRETSGGGSSANFPEEFSFYGAALDPVDVSAIWTRIKVGGEEMTLTAVQLAAKMDLDPRVRVRDCRKKRGSRDGEKSPNGGSTSNWMTNGLSSLSSVGKSLLGLGSLWSKKSAPTASGPSSSSPSASCSAATVRPRPHLQCRHPGCGRRFSKASRLAEHGRSHRRERAAVAPDERLPTPDIEILATQLVEEKLQRCPPVRPEEDIESEDEEDPISRQCAVAAERRMEEERRKGKKI